MPAVSVDTTPGFERTLIVRALDFYHQRSAVQASPAVLAALGLHDLA